LEVHGEHAYRVSDLGILVHNNCAAPIGSGTKGVRNVIEGHHQLPKQFRDQFRKVGLNIEDYVIDLDKAAHRLKPGGLHTGRGAENWNGAWRDFFRNNPNPSRQDIVKQLTSMRQSFGLE
jgi:hypothetical protein